VGGVSLLPTACGHLANPGFFCRTLASLPALAPTTSARPSVSTHSMRSDTAWLTLGTACYKDNGRQLYNVPEGTQLQHTVSLRTM
jgi:hypothetical protein